MDSGLQKGGREVLQAQIVSERALLFPCTFIDILSATNIGLTFVSASDVDMAVAKIATNKAVRI